LVSITRKRTKRTAIDVISHRLFVVNDNKLMIILNTDNGKLVAKINIVQEVDGVGI